MTIRALCAVLCIASCVTAGAANPEAGMERIRQAFLRRQSAAQSGRVEWAWNSFHPKGALDGMPQVPTSGAFPQGDTSLQHRTIFEFDGSSSQTITEGWTWTPDEGGPVKTIVSTSFDGNISKLLSRRVNLDKAYGFVAARDELPRCRDICIIPIIMSLRPLDPSCGVINLDKCWIESTGRTVRNINTTVVHAGDLDQYALWYLDPLKDYAMIRYEFIANGRALVQVDIENEHTSAGWVPNEWKGTWMLKNGSMFMGLHAKLMASEVNSHSEGRIFSLSFPPGTIVNDSTIADRAQRVSIVRANGRQVMVPRSDWDKIGKISTNFATTESSSHSHLKSPIGVGSLFAIISAAVLGGGSLAFMARRRGIQMPRPKLFGFLTSFILSLSVLGVTSAYSQSSQCQWWCIELLCHYTAKNECAVWQDYQGGCVYDVELKADWGYTQYSTLANYYSIGLCSAVCDDIPSTAGGCTSSPTAVWVEVKKQGCDGSVSCR